MKRAPLEFDTRYFAKKTSAKEKPSTEEIFREIYHNNHWIGTESVSGQGSENEQTREISIQIPELVRQLGVERFLDVPCGDFNWFRKMNMPLKKYIGGDILSQIIDRNNAQFKSDVHEFVKLDLIKDKLPKADILLCRDCLVHLSFEDIFSVLENVKKSPITYLLSTTFTECDENIDIVTGDWRIINLEKPPFNLPKPFRLINEKCTEGEGTYADKSLGLWKICELGAED